MEKPGWLRLQRGSFCEHLAKKGQPLALSVKAGTVPAIVGSFFLWFLLLDRLDIFFISAYNLQKQAHKPVLILTIFKKPTIEKTIMKNITTIERIAMQKTNMEKTAMEKTSIEKITAKITTTALLFFWHYSL